MSIPTGAIPNPQTVGDLLPESATRRLALFDVCGTLYTSNTTFDFLEYYWSKKGGLRFFFFRLSRSVLGRALWKLISHIWGRDLFRIASIRTLAGERCDEVQSIAQIFVRDVLATRHIVPVLDIVREQR